MKLNLFGRGLRLQVAITIACQLSFVLFGCEDIPNDQQAQQVQRGVDCPLQTIRVSFPELWGTRIGDGRSVTQGALSKASSSPSTTSAPSRDVS